MAVPSGLTLARLAVEAGGARLLEHLDLTVRRGELVGLSGPSGLGKSTLLRVIAGLIDAAAGRALLDGRAPDAVGWPRFRRRVVHVAQRPVLLDDTVLSNLSRPFLYGSAEGEFPANRARALMKQLGLQDRLEQRARTLSVGQQQRLALARALLVEPDFLLLDEPTSALDPESISTVEALIRERVDRGDLGGLVVSHDRGQLERWCDRVVDLGDFAVASEAGEAT